MTTVAILPSEHCQAFWDVARMMIADGMDPRTAYDYARRFELRRLLNTDPEIAVLPPRRDS